jgi:hypothetical protein
MRLQQHERSVLKSLGFETPEQAKERLERAKKLEEEEQARQEAAKTELERERDRAKKAEEKAAKLETEKLEAERSARLTQACVEKGVRNVGYARYLVTERLRADQNLTEAVALEEALKDEQQRIALGVTAPPPAPNLPTTTPPLTPPGTPPPAPAPNGAKDAMQMSREEWLEQRRTLGLR